MATETITKLRDDLDGSVATTTVKFGWNGTEYEIDLSKKNASDLESALRPFVSAGRRASGPSVRKAATKTAAAKPSASKVSLEEVRAWASKNGHKVAARGRVAAAVIEAFEGAKKATTSAVDAVSAAPAKVAKAVAKSPAKKAPAKKAAARKVAAKKAPAKKVAAKKVAANAPAKRPVGRPRKVVPTVAVVTDAPATPVEVAVTT
jgi:hypothetical protein